MSQFIELHMLGQPILFNRTLIVAVYPGKSGKHSEIATSDREVYMAEEPYGIVKTLLEEVD